MTDCIVVLVTVGSPEQGEKIAEAVVGERLAACVNIVGPIRSIYRWQERVEHDQELLLVIKTRTALFDQLAARVAALHSYETPEVIAVPIAAGAEPYVQWLLGATRPAAG